MNSVREADEDLIRYVYLLKLHNEDEALYIVDADYLEDRRQGRYAQDELSGFGDRLEISSYPVMRQAFEERKNLVERDFYYDEEFEVNSLSGYAPIFAEDGQTLLALLCIDVIDVDMQAALADVTRLSLWLTIGAVAVALLTSIMLGAYFTRGILSLERIVRRFGERDFQARSDIESTDEVGRLSRSFNHMAETIAGYSERLQALLESYGKFVPHDLLKLLGRASILEVKMGDQVRSTMSVLFSDIRDFTSLSEKMSPEENFNFLNSYLRRVGPGLLQKRLDRLGGIIDKYIGDAVMALFPTRADDAINAAVAMALEVRSYNVQRQQQGFDALRIGIGIHTGALMLGTVGEEERMDTTVISDAVNLASRPEGLTKFYGVTILVSEETIESLDDRKPFGFRFVDQVQVKGKQSNVKIYEVFDAEPEPIAARRRNTMSDYVEGIRLYRRGDFGSAEEVFLRLASDDSDPVAALYLQRSRLRRETPPGEGWRPVEILDSK